MGTVALNWPHFRRQQWLCSPHLLAWQEKILRKLQTRVPNAPGVLWLLSSGTQSTGTVKALALSEESFLVSAAAVNAHLQSDSQDCWLIALPHYHVGGLSIYARAFLSGARTVEFREKWNPSSFTALIERERVTLSSLVPTQIHDLVVEGLRSPASLRAIVVGGGALSPELYLRARALGWPLLPSYGLTECCSQVATASLQSLDGSTYPDFAILPHVEVELRESRVFLRSKAVCRWVAVGREDGSCTLEDPAPGGWLATEDLAELHSGALRFLGRRDDVVKVLGELVPLQEVEQQARRFFAENELTVIAVEDARKGATLCLLTNSSRSLREWSACLEVFNRTQPGPRRIDGFGWVGEIPRNEMGKIKKAQLKRLFG